MTEQQPVALGAVLADIHNEVRRAEAMHAPINSAHEGYSVILEELDEFWEQVKRKSSRRSKREMRTELIQTAAMCVRTIRDVIDKMPDTMQKLGETQDWSETLDCGCTVSKGWRCPVHDAP